MGRDEHIEPVRELPRDHSAARPIVIAFGANLGDRRAAILRAAHTAAGLLHHFELSTIIETAPVGVGLEKDPPFLNAAGVGESARPSRELLAALQAIEAAASRARPYPGAPRTLDVDLILAGDEVVDEPGLTLPHPRFRDRLFVLEPLAEIAPDLRDPITGLSVRELLEKKKAGA
jgi:2-amino-4-hydroxy-6-hydroxymethyldihydropteridine diphosphokinase